MTATVIPATVLPASIVSGLLADPVVVVVATFAAAFGLCAVAAASALVERRTRQRRVKAVVSKRSSRPAGETVAWRAGMLALMRLSTRGFSIMKDRQLEETRRMLVSAGYRSRDAVVVFSFFKLVLPLAFLGGAALVVYGTDPIGRGPMLDIAAVVAAALLGSKLPEMVVKRKRAARLESVRKALPDALDMLVICAEAGLASDALLKRVVAEMGTRAGVLADELQQTALELSFMPERRQALENLAERCPIPSVLAFTNTLIQAERYGTPLARAYKVLSQEQRAERMMRAEEKAGRLPATMTVPMMLFILPALFVVLIGPAVLDILDNFIN